MNAFPPTSDVAVTVRRLPMIFPYTRLFGAQFVVADNSGADRRVRLERDGETRLGMVRVGEPVRTDRVLPVGRVADERPAGSPRHTHVPGHPAEGPQAAGRPGGGEPIVEVRVGRANDLTQDVDTAATDAPRGR